MAGQFSERDYAQYAQSIEQGALAATEGADGAAIVGAN
jgi:hypothetical protein